MSTSQRPGFASPPPSYVSNANGPNPANGIPMQNIPNQQQQQPRVVKPEDDLGPPPPYTFEEKFPIHQPKYNDLWAAVLFLATMAGLVAVSGISIRGYALTRNTNGTGIMDGKQHDFGLSTNALILLAIVLGVAIVVSMVYLSLVRRFTKGMIYATAIGNIVLGLGTAIYYLYRRQLGAGIVFILFALFYAFCFWTWRRSIPFTVVMVQTSIDVAKRFGHVWRVAALSGLAAIAAGGWFAVTFVSVYVKFSPDPSNPACQLAGGCSKAKVIGLLVFVVFAFYWLSEVIKNVSHTSVSGVYASWYFMARSGVPKHPTFGAFKRATTYSFGSICFGSLIVSIIQLLNQAAAIAQQDAAMDGNIAMTIVFCVLRGIIMFAQWLIEFFNHYAFSYIAIYGEALIPAAKATWRFMKERGLDALIQQCLIDPILTAGAVFTGYLCGLLAYLYLQFTHPAYNANGGYTVVIMAFSFLIGLQVCNCVLVPIKSGVSTIFTSIAFDPAVLINDHEVLYGEILHVYPDVATMVHA